MQVYRGSKCKSRYYKLFYFIYNMLILLVNTCFEASELEGVKTQGQRGSKRKATGWRNANPEGVKRQAQREPKRKVTRPSAPAKKGRVKGV